MNKFSFDVDKDLHVCIERLKCMLGFEEDKAQNDRFLLPLPFISTPIMVVDIFVPDKILKDFVLSLLL